ncbi:hypothetical protein [Mycobacterium sp. MAA66]|uniref:hypothetical protein n=1 Tax=Mycobacterium sp. MAA66 TaxID=3156297 RepID=UPI003517EA69
MAYSADRELRQLGAALLPYLPELDYDAMDDMAGDAAANVRSELATSLKKITTSGASPDEDRIALLVNKLREDPSFRVRSQLSLS